VVAGAAGPDHLRRPRIGRQGGVIKRITERTSSRIVRVVAMPKPTEREQTRWYFERMLVRSGIKLLKYWFSVSWDEIVSGLLLGALYALILVLESIWPV
jgi:hypothetical protein